MEVTCERCKAEYDFDDSLVGESGTSVKCTDCGHVFRVFPAPGSDQTGRGRLQIRFRDGRIERLASLRELQRRARDGEVSLEDEIGREGFDWRPLHTVPELRGFFEPSQSARPTGGTTKPVQGSLAVTPSLHPSGRAPAAGPSSIPSPAKQTMVGIGPASGAASAGAASPAMRAPQDPAAAKVAPRGAGPSPAAPRVAKPVGQAPAPAQSPVPRVTGSAPKPPPAQAPSPSQPSPKLYLADDDAAELPSARRSVGGGSLRWIGLGVLVAGGVWFGVNALGSGGLSNPFAASENPVEAAASQAAQHKVEEVPPPAQEAPDGGAAAPTVQPLKTEKAEPTKDKPQAEKPASKAPNKAARAKPKPKAASARREERSRRDEPAREEEPEDESKLDYGTLVGKAGRALDRGEFGRAEALLKHALEQRGSGSEANSGMGFALLGQGKPAAAVAFFQTAARNGFAAASVGLGDAYAKMGRKADAVEAYQGYLRRLPGGSRAGYARSRIEALGGPDGDDGAREPSSDAPTPEESPSAPREAEEPQPEDEGGEDYVPAGALSEDGL